MVIKKNHAKGATFAYAFKRMNESIRDCYYLEAITLAESIISDRLYSFVKFHESVGKPLLHEKEKKAAKRTSLGNLTTKARRYNNVQSLTKSGQNMFDAIDEWRDARNECIHSIAKSEPGTPTVSVDEFIELARNTAVNGKQLARLVCDWHKKEND